MNGNRSGAPPGFRMGPHHLWAFIYRPRQYYAWLCKKYGDIVTLVAPHSPLVMTLTPEGAREVLTASPDDYDAFQKQAFRGPSGDGSLFVLEGEVHKRERQMLMPAFHTQHLRTYAQAIQEIARAHAGSWTPGAVIKAKKAMLAVSRDVILRVVFGEDFEEIKGEGRIALARVLDAAHPLIEFTPNLQAGWFPPWRRFQREKRNFIRFVNRALALRQARESESYDVVTLLLGARDEEGRPKPPSDILDELYSILLPGHATTGLALAWALYELGRHPQVLTQLRGELDALGSEPDPVIIARQPYLDAVCKETMRLHTIVTETARLTRTPRKLLGYCIPAGVGVGIGMSAIHQDAAIYPEPAVFRPARFLARTFSPFEFLPFGGGHRRCLGAALSDFEMRITLATIVTQLDFEPLREERENRQHLAMGPKYGVSLRLSERSA